LDDVMNIRKDRSAPGFPTPAIHGWNLVLVLSIVTRCAADEDLFRDDFKRTLGDGWSWIREHREAWRVSERGLEVRVEPGNMWGPANDAKNVLLRTAPDTAKGEIEISVNVENRPTGQ